MIVNDALIQLGENPVKRSPFSSVIVAMVNSYLKKSAIEPITSNTRADHVIARIWELPTDTRLELMEQKVGVMRDRDTYRLTLTLVSVVIVVFVVLVGVVEILSVGTENSGAGFAIVGQLLNVFLTFLENATP